jgi:hypothetical protein
MWYAYHPISMRVAHINESFVYGEALIILGFLLDEREKLVICIALLNCPEEGIVIQVSRLMVWQLLK